MQCQVFNCDGTANYPFKACNMAHGVLLRDTLADLKDFQQGKLKISDLYAGRGLDIPIEQLNHYAKLI